MARLRDLFARGTLKRGVDPDTEVALSAQSGPFVTLRSEWTGILVDGGTVELPEIVLAAGDVVIQSAATIKVTAYDVGTNATDWIRSGFSGTIGTYVATAPATGIYLPGAPAPPYGKLVFNTISTDSTMATGGTLTFDVAVTDGDAAPTDSTITAHIVFVVSKVHMDSPLNPFPSD